MRIFQPTAVVLVAALAGPTAAEPLVDVDAGTGHECTLDAKGVVACAGRNEFGQLGDGTTRDRSGLRRVELPSAAVSIAVGGTVSCALLEGGVPWCWGATLESDEVLVAASAPRKVGLSDVVELAVGGVTACARLADGTVQCWGANNVGQLGDGTRIGRGVPAPVAGLQGVRTVAVGGEHACAVVADGTVVCWGWNTNQQLGDGTSVNRSRPGPVTGLGGVVSLGLGLQHSCAVLGDGRVACWGRARRGQLGSGGDLNDPSYRAESRPVFARGITDAEEVAAGGSFTCVRHRSGSVSCFGANDTGQLGDGTNAPRALPGPVEDLSSVVAIDAARDAVFAIRSDGRLWRWGRLEPDSDEGVARKPVAR